MSGSTSGSAGRMRAFARWARAAIGVDRRIHKPGGIGQVASPARHGPGWFREVRVSAHPLDELADFAKGGGRKENHGGTSYSPFVPLRYQADSHFGSNLGLWISILG